MFKNLIITRKSLGSNPLADLNIFLIPGYISVDFVFFIGFVSFSRFCKFAMNILICV